MTNFGRSFRAALVMGIMIVGVTTGCSKKEGPMERTGKETDKSAEKTGEKIDKAVEKTGDKIENTGEKIKDSVK